MPRPFLLVLFDLNMDLILFFGDAFTVSNYAANKELVAMAKEKRMLVRGDVKLSDADSLILHDRIEQVSSFYANHDFAHIKTLDASFSSIPWTEEVRKHNFRFLWQTVDDLLCRNRKHLETLKLTINFPLDIGFWNRKFFCMKRTFKNLTSITIYNPKQTTSFVLEILKRMPALREVVIFGNVSMTPEDAVMKRDLFCIKKLPCYSFGNLPVMLSIPVVLPNCLEVLDIIGGKGFRNATLFATELGYAMRQHRFLRLKRLGIRDLFMTMMKPSGTTLLERLHLCPSLEWVGLGDATKFKQWQNEAVAKLRADCPHLIVDCT